MSTTTIMLVAVAAGLAACGKVYDETGSRSHGLNRPLLTTASVRTVQRHGFDGIDRASGRVIPSAITCAEPSPDVALAFGEGRSRGLTLGGLEALLAPPAAAAGAARPSAGDLNVALSLAASHAEAVAQLGERLATIQLLRDGLYRACEAYANGAITPTIYTLMVSRMDELLVTLLSTEIAGGAFGRGFATAAAGGSADAQASQAAAAAAEQAATGALAAANQAARDLADEQNELGRRQGRLDATPADAPERAERQREVDDQRTTVEQAEQELETKQQEALDALGELDVVQLTAARSAAQALAGTGGTIQGRTGSAVSDPADAIREIQMGYLNDTNADAAIVACIAELTTTAAVPETLPASSHGVGSSRPSMLARLCADQVAFDVKEFIQSELEIKRAQMSDSAAPAVADARLKMAFAEMARESCASLAPDPQAACVERLRHAYFGSP